MPGTTQARRLELTPGAPSVGSSTDAGGKNGDSGGARAGITSAPPTQQMQSKFPAAAGTEKAEKREKLTKKEKGEIKAEKKENKAKEKAAKKTGDVLGSALSKFGDGGANSGPDQISNSADDDDAPAMHWFFKWLMVFVVVAGVSYGIIYAQWEQQEWGDHEYSLAGTTALNLDIKHCLVDMIGRPDAATMRVRYKTGAFDGSDFAMPPEGPGFGPLDFQLHGGPSKNPGGVRIQCKVLFEIPTHGLAEVPIRVVQFGGAPRSQLTLDRFEMGLLGVNATNMGFRSRGIVVTSADIGIVVGAADLGDGIAFRDSGAPPELSVVVGRGDVIVAPTGIDEVDLLWDQPCGYVCLPAGYFVDDSHCADGLAPDRNTTNVSMASNVTGGLDPDTALRLRRSMARARAERRRRQTRRQEAGNLSDGDADAENANETNSTCADENCEACDEDDLSLCIECGNSLYLHEGSCFESCPDGFAGVGDNEIGRICGAARGCQKRQCTGAALGIHMGTFTMFGDFESEGLSSPADGGPGGLDLHRVLKAYLRATSGTVYLVDNERQISPVLEGITTTKAPLQNTPFQGSDYGRKNNSAGGAGSGDNMELEMEYDEHQTDGFEQPGNGSDYAEFRDLTGFVINRGHRILEPLLSDQLALSLSTLLSGKNEFDDALFRVAFETFRPRTMYLPSTRPVFLDFPPGLLAAFSGGLLSPMRDLYIGQLYPGFCPYRLPAGAVQGPLGQTYRTGTVKQLIEDGIDGWAEAKGGAYVIGFLTEDGKVETYNSDSQRPSGFSVAQRSIDAEPILVPAIILSLVLCIFLGIALSVAVSKSMALSIIEFKKFITQNEKFLAFSEGRETETSGEDGGDEAAEESSEGGVTTEMMVTAEQKLKKISAGNHFEVVDVFWGIYSSTQQNSLKLFCQLYFEPEWSMVVARLFGAKPDDPWIRITDFESFYQKFCAALKIQPKAISGKNEKRIDQFAKRDKRVNNLTEVFTGIVFRRTPAKHVDQEADTPLAQFISQFCELSVYDYDWVFAQEFRARFEAWCVKNDHKKTPVREKDMLEFGCTFERRSLTFVGPLLEKGLVESEEDAKDSMADAAKKKGKAAFDMALRISLYHPVAKEFYAVLVHVATTIVIPLPLVAVAFLEQMYSAQYSARPGRAYPDDESDEFYQFNDALTGPEAESEPKLVYEDKKIAWYNLAIFYLALVFYGVSLLELLLHYARISSKGVPYRSILFRILRIFVKIFYFPPVIFFTAGLLAYIGLVAIWAVLAAIINPQKYLPMAAMSLTFVTTILAKFKALLALRKRFLERIKLIIKAKAMAVLREIKGAFNMKANIGGLGVSKLALKAENILLGALGPFAADLDLEVEDLLELCRGHIPTIKKVSLNLGIDFSVCWCIVSIGRQDFEALRLAIRDLAPKINLDPDLAVSFMGVIASITKQSIRLAFKGLLIDMVKLGKLGKLRLPFKGIPVPDILMSLPDLVEAMMIIAKEIDFGPFVDLCMRNVAISGKIPFPPELLALIFSAIAGNDLRLQFECLKLVVKLKKRTAFYKTLVTATINTAPLDWYIYPSLSDYLWQKVGADKMIQFLKSDPLISFFLAVEGAIARDPKLVGRAVDAQDSGSGALRNPFGVRAPVLEALLLLMGQTEGGGNPDPRIVIEKRMEILEKASKAARGALGLAADMFDAAADQAGHVGGVLARSHLNAKWDYGSADESGAGKKGKGQTAIRKSRGSPMLRGAHIWTMSKTSMKAVKAQVQKVRGLMSTSKSERPEEVLPTKAMPSTEAKADAKTILHYPKTLSIFQLHRRPTESISWEEYVNRPTNGGASLKRASERYRPHVPAKICGPPTAVSKNGDEGKILVATYGPSGCDVTQGHVSVNMPMTTEKLASTIFSAGDVLFWERTIYIDGKPEPDYLPIGIVKSITKETERGPMSRASAGKPQIFKIRFDFDPEVPIDARTLKNNDVLYSRSSKFSVLERYADADGVGSFANHATGLFSIESWGMGYKVSAVPEDSDVQSGHSPSILKQMPLALGQESEPAASERSDYKRGGGIDTTIFKHYVTTQHFILLERSDTQAALDVALASGGNPVAGPLPVTIPKGIVKYPLQRPEASALGDKWMVEIKSDPDDKLILDRLKESVQLPGSSWSNLIVAEAQVTYPYRQAMKIDERNDESCIRLCSHTFSDSNAVKELRDVSDVTAEGLAVIAFDYSAPIDGQSSDVFLSQLTAGMLTLATRGKLDDFPSNNSYVYSELEMIDHDGNAISSVPSIMCCYLAKTGILMLPKSSWPRCYDENIIFDVKSKAFMDKTTKVKQNESHTDTDAQFGAEVVSAGMPWSAAGRFRLKDNHATTFIVGPVTHLYTECADERAAPVAMSLSGWPQSDVSDATVDEGFDPEDEPAPDVIETNPIGTQSYGPRFLLDSNFKMDASPTIDFMPDLLRVPSRNHAQDLSKRVLGRKEAEESWSQYFISLGILREPEETFGNRSKNSRWLGLRGTNPRVEGGVTEQELHLRRRGREYQDIEHDVQLVSSSGSTTGTTCSIAAIKGRVVRVVVTASGSDFAQTLAAYNSGNRPQFYTLLGAGGNRSAEVIIGPVTHPYAPCVDDVPLGQYSFELDTSISDHDYVVEARRNRSLPQTPPPRRLPIQNACMRVQERRIPGSEAPGCFPYNFEKEHTNHPFPIRKPPETDVNPGRFPNLDDTPMCKGCQAARTAQNERFKKKGAKESWASFFCKLDGGCEGDEHVKLPAQDKEKASRTTEKGLEGNRLLKYVHGCLKETVASGTAEKETTVVLQRRGPTGKRVELKYTNNPYDMTYMVNQDSGTCHVADVLPDSAPHRKMCKDARVVSIGGEVDAPDVDNPKQVIALLKAQLYNGISVTGMEAFEAMRVRALEHPDEAVPQEEFWKAICDLMRLYLVGCAIPEEDDVGRKMWRRGSAEDLDGPDGLELRDTCRIWVDKCTVWKKEDTAELPKIDVKVIELNGTMQFFTIAEESRGAMLQIPIKEACAEFVEAVKFGTFFDPANDKTVWETRMGEFWDSDISKYLSSNGFSAIGESEESVAFVAVHDWTNTAQGDVDMVSMYYSFARLSEQDKQKAKSALDKKKQSYQSLGKSVQQFEIKWPMAEDIVIFLADGEKRNNTAACMLAQLLWWMHNHKLASVDLPPPFPSRLRDVVVSPIAKQLGLPDPHLFGGLLAMLRGTEFDFAKMASIAGVADIPGVIGLGILMNGNPQDGPTAVTILCDALSIKRGHLDFFWQVTRGCFGETDSTILSYSLFRSFIKDIGIPGDLLTNDTCSVLMAATTLAVLCTAAVLPSNNENRVYNWVPGVVGRVVLAEALDLFFKLAGCDLADTSLIKARLDFVNTCFDRKKLGQDAQRMCGVEVSADAKEQNMSSDGLQSDGEVEDMDESGGAPKAKSGKPLRRRSMTLLSVVNASPKKKAAKDEQSGTDSVATMGEYLISRLEAMFLRGTRMANSEGLARTIAEALIPLPNGKQLKLKEVQNSDVRKRFEMAILFFVQSHNDHDTLSRTVSLKSPSILRGIFSDLITCCKPQLELMNEDDKEVEEASRRQDFLSVATKIGYGAKKLRNFLKVVRPGRPQPMVEPASQLIKQLGGLTKSIEIDLWKDLVTASIYDIAYLRWCVRNLAASAQDEFGRQLPKEGLFALLLGDLRSGAARGTFFAGVQKAVELAQGATIEGLAEGTRKVMETILGQDRDVVLQGAVGFAQTDIPRIREYMDLCAVHPNRQYVENAARKKAFKEEQPWYIGAQRVEQWRGLKIVLALLNNDLDSLIRVDPAYEIEETSDATVEMGSPMKFLVKKMRSTTSLNATSSEPSLELALEGLIRLSFRPSQQSARPGRMLADRLGIPRPFVAALMAQLMNDNVGLNRSLRELCSSIRNLDPAIAAGCMAIGLSDVSGLDELFNKRLKLDIEVIEGLVSLTFGTAGSIRAAIPPLARKLRVNADVLVSLTALAAGAVDALDDLGEQLELQSSIPTIKALCDMMASRDASRVATGVARLRSLHNLDITDLHTATGLVALAKGETSIPMETFSQFGYDELRTAAVVLSYQLFRMPTGGMLSFKTLAFSLIPKCMRPIAEYLGITNAADLDPAIWFLCGCFFAGAKGEKRGFLEFALLFGNAEEDTFNGATFFSGKPQQTDVPTPEGSSFAALKAAGDKFCSLNELGASKPTFKELASYILVRKGRVRGTESKERHFWVMQALYQLGVASRSVTVPKDMLVNAKKCGLLDAQYNTPSCSVYGLKFHKGWGDAPIVGPMAESAHVTKSFFVTQPLLNFRDHKGARAEVPVMLHDLFESAVSLSAVITMSEENLNATQKTRSTSCCRSCDLEKDLFCKEWKEFKLIHALITAGGKTLDAEERRKVNNATKRLLEYRKLYWDTLLSGKVDGAAKAKLGMLRDWVSMVTNPTVDFDKAEKEEQIGTLAPWADTDLGQAGLIHQIGCKLISFFYIQTNRDQELSATRPSVPGFASAADELIQAARTTADTVFNYFKTQDQECDLPNPSQYVKKRLAKGSVGELERWASEISTWEFIFEPQWDDSIVSEIEQVMQRGHGGVPRWAKETGLVGRDFETIKPISTKVWRLDGEQYCDHCFIQSCKGTAKCIWGESKQRSELSDIWCKVMMLGANSDVNYSLTHYIKEVQTQYIENVNAGSNLHGDHDTYIRRGDPELEEEVEDSRGFAAPSAASDIEVLLNLTTHAEISSPGFATVLLPIINNDPPPSEDGGHHPTASAISTGSYTLKAYSKLGLPTAPYAVVLLDVLSRSVDGGMESSEQMKPLLSKLGVLKREEQDRIWELTVVAMGSIVPFHENGARYATKLGVSQHYILMLACASVLEDLHSGTIDCLPVFLKDALLSFHSDLKITADAGVKFLSDKDSVKLYEELICAAAGNHRALCRLAARSNLMTAETVHDAAPAKIGLYQKNPMDLLVDVALSNEVGNDDAETLAKALLLLNRKVASELSEADTASLRIATVVVQLLSNNNPDDEACEAMEQALGLIGPKAKALTKAQKRKADAEVWKHNPSVIRALFVTKYRLKGSGLVNQFLFGLTPSGSQRITRNERKPFEIYGMDMHDRIFVDEVLESVVNQDAFDKRVVERLKEVFPDHKNLSKGPGGQLAQAKKMIAGQLADTMTLVTFQDVKRLRIELKNAEAAADPQGAKDRVAQLEGIIIKFEQLGKTSQAHLRHVLQQTAERAVRSIITMAVPCVTSQFQAQAFAQLSSRIVEAGVKSFGGTGDMALAAKLSKARFAKVIERLVRSNGSRVEVRAAIGTLQRDVIIADVSVELTSAMATAFKQIFDIMTRNRESSAAELAGAIWRLKEARGDRTKLKVAVEELQELVIADVTHDFASSLNQIVDVLRATVGPAVNLAFAIESLAANPRNRKKTEAAVTALVDLVAADALDASVPGLAVVVEALRSPVQFVMKGTSTELAKLAKSVERLVRSQRKGAAAVNGSKNELVVVASNLSEEAFAELQTKINSASALDRSTLTLKLRDSIVRLTRSRGNLDETKIAVDALQSVIVADPAGATAVVAVLAPSTRPAAMLAVALEGLAQSRFDPAKAERAAIELEALIVADALESRAPGLASVSEALRFKRTAKKDKKGTDQLDKVAAVIERLAQSTDPIAVDTAKIELVTVVGKLSDSTVQELEQRFGKQPSLVEQLDQLIPILMSIAEAADAASRRPAAIRSLTSAIMNLVRCRKSRVEAKGAADALHRKLIGGAARSKSALDLMSVIKAIRTSADKEFKGATNVGGKPIYQSFTRRPNTLAGILLAPAIFEW